MSRITLTQEIARAAATDAGNRSMRKAGRTVWSVEDFNAASTEYERLCPPNNQFPIRTFIRCNSSYDGLLCSRERDHNGLHQQFQQQTGTGAGIGANRKLIAWNDESSGAKRSCQAGSDGECYWDNCPQIKDGEPEKTNRSCPLYDWSHEDEY